MPRSPGSRLAPPARTASRARQGRRDLDDLYRRGAIYVLRTAKALRLAIPQSLLRRADAVID